MQSDVVERFLDVFGCGRIGEALQQILSHPDIEYDKFKSEEEELLKAIINYSDASVNTFHLRDTLVANEYLQHVLEQKKYIIRFNNALQVLRYESQILVQILSQNKEKTKHLYPPLRTFVEQEMMDAEIPSHIEAELIQNIPLYYRKVIVEKFQFNRNWNEFKKKKPLFAVQITKHYGAMIKPWHCITYPTSKFIRNTLNGKNIPVLFMQPFEGLIFNQFNFSQAVLVFENKSQFFQCLQIPEGRDLLIHPRNLIFIMELYPNEQFRTQIWEKNESKLDPVLFIPDPYIEDVMDNFIDAFSECINQTREQMDGESLCSDWLYQLSKKILHRKGAKLFGEKRAASFVEKTDAINWRDSHRNIPLHKNLGPNSEDYFAKKLQKLAKNRKLRSIDKSKNRFTVVHVTPQIGNGVNHPLTRLLDNIFSYYDEKRFENILVITERMALRPAEYPYSPYNSSTCMQRAPDMIKQFQSKGVVIQASEVTSDSTFDQTVCDLSNLLTKFKSDFVVFHGPDVINNMCTQVADTPYRILFDHGTFPEYPGYDFMILSTDDSLKIYENKLLKLNTVGLSLPYAVALETQNAKKYSRSDFGLPEDGFILTTISKHLENRVTFEMKKAIIEILKNNPKSYWAPIGHIFKNHEFMLPFIQNGVGKQVIPLGFQDNPEQISQILNAYLNEYPVGSGLGVLDAMAAGCPVITMYDKSGAQQASRYGGSYFGIDRAIQSCDWNDYVSVASRLIRDPVMYAEWRQHALNQYKKHSDVKSYVKHFERLLESIDLLRNS